MERLEVQVNGLGSKVDHFVDTSNTTSRDLQHKMRDQMRFFVQRTDRFFYFFVASIVAFAIKLLYEEYNSKSKKKD